MPVAREIPAEETDSVGQVIVKVPLSREVAVAVTVAEGPVIATLDARRLVAEALHDKLGPDTASEAFVEVLVAVPIAVSAGPRT